jgi:hypothetical protein
VPDSAGYGQPGGAQMMMHDLFSFFYPYLCIVLVNIGQLHDPSGGLCLRSIAREGRWFAKLLAFGEIIRGNYRRK